MRLVYGFCLAAAILVACSGDDTTVTDAPDGSSDGASDGAALDDGNVPADASQDATAHDGAATDGSQTDGSQHDAAATDGGNDATVNDGGNDAATDAGSDAATDAATDAASDAATDAGADAAADAGSDAAADAGADSGADAGLNPTFTNVYTTIINGTCTGCHSAAGMAGGLDMSSQSAAYLHLVNVKAAGGACGSTNETRVVPGNSAASLLFNKVNGTQDCGVRMPIGGPILSADKILLIEAWIDIGAPNN